MLTVAADYVMLEMETIAGAKPLLVPASSDDDEDGYSMVKTAT